MSLSFLMCVGIAACHEPRSRASHGGPRDGGRLVIGIEVEPRDFDQTTQLASIEGYASNLLGAGLVTLAPDGRIVPVLARDWSQSEDGKRLTFHLRNDVRYASGRKLVSRDFQATLERMLDPATASPIRDLLQGVTSIRTPDDVTLVLELDKPNFTLLPVLTDLQPIDPQALARWGTRYGEHPSSVGPCRLKTARSGESTLLARNPDYRWGPPFVHRGPWHFEEIELRVIPESSARVAALESGEITVLQPVPDTALTRLRSDPRFQVFDGPALSIELLQMNHEDEILADVRVRRALQHALDRDAIIRATWEGHGTVGYGAIPPLARGALGGADAPPLARPYEPAVARRLLEEAGWRDVGGDHVRVKDGKRLALSLIVPVRSYLMLEAELIQAQLRAVGVETTLSALEPQTAWEKCRRGDFDLVIYGIDAFLPDATITLTLLLASSQIGEGANYSRYRNAEMDGLLRRARETTSEREHLDALAEVQRTFARDAVFATIGYPTVANAVSRKLRGARQHPLFQSLILDDAWLARDE